jgi:hypothetical protein
VTVCGLFLRKQIFRLLLLRLLGSSTFFTKHSHPSPNNPKPTPSSLTYHTNTPPLIAPLCYQLSTFPKM